MVSCDVVGFVTNVDVGSWEVAKARVVRGKRVKTLAFRKDTILWFDEDDAITSHVFSLTSLFRSSEK